MGAFLSGDVGDNPIWMRLHEVQRIVQAKSMVAFSHRGELILIVHDDSTARASLEVLARHDACLT
jgi:hypothetical protein